MIGRLDRWYVNRWADRCIHTYIWVKRPIANCIHVSLYIQLHVHQCMHCRSWRLMLTVCFNLFPSQISEPVSPWDSTSLVELECLPSVLHGSSFLHLNCDSTKDMSHSKLLPIEFLELQTQLLRLVQQTLSWQNHCTDPKYIKYNYRVKCKYKWLDNK